MKAQQTQSYDIPLHDIKPLVEVQEYSLYYFLGASLFALILTGLLIYLIYMWFKKRNAFSLRKEHFKLLGQLDLSDTKSLLGYEPQDDAFELFNVQPESNEEAGELAISIESSARGKL